jgi:transcriptional regulator
VVPTQFSLVGDEVWFHLAAPNPVFAALAEQPMALLSVAPDWAYIPGAWKAIGDEDPRSGIPTTYYAAVQLAGPARVEADPGEIAAVLRHQLGEQEPGADYVDPLRHGARLRAIRAVKLQIETVRAKYKFGGNVDAEHRRAVDERLAQRNRPGDAAARAHLAELSVELDAEG